MRGLITAELARHAERALPDMTARLDAIALRRGDPYALAREVVRALLGDGA